MRAKPKPKKTLRLPTSIGTKSKRSSGLLAGITGGNAANLLASTLTDTGSLTSFMCTQGFHTPPIIGTSPADLNDFVTR